MQLLCSSLVNLLIIVFSPTFKSVESSSTVSKRSVVVIGEKVEMNCSVNGTAITNWQFTAWNNSTATIIYHGEVIITSLKYRYTIDNNVSGQHNLIIDSVDFAHAGRYQCTTSFNTMSWNEVHLVVLGSGPVCTANTTKTHLSSWCSFSYKGNGSLVFTWTKSNAEKNIVANLTTSGTSQGPVINTSSIMEHIQANESGVTFHCQIIFQMPDNMERVHIYTWNHTLYGPRNLSIIEFDDRLECFAEGDPTPTYRWLHVETNTSTDESVFVLNSATMTSENDNDFLCTASNVFANETKNFTIAAKISTAGKQTTTYGGEHMDADKTTDGSILITTVTAIAIGGSLFIFLTIVIVFSCVVHKKRLKDIKSNRPDVASNTYHLSYDDIALSSEGTLIGIKKGDRLPERSGGSTISDNAVYAKVCKPKGQAKGSKGGDKSKPAPQNKNQEKKNYVGEDGTVYAELSAMKPPVSKGKAVAKSTPAFSQVEIYAAIDHSGTVPAPPLVSK